MSGNISYLKIGSWTLPKRGLFVLFGSTLILVACSLDYSYGNLNTYVTSYLRKNNPQITYADWVFVSQSKTIFGAILSPFGGEVARRLGIRLSLIIGSIIYAGGYLLTYFSLDWGLWPVVFTIGAFHGIGYGLTYTPAISSILKWFPAHKGTFASIAVAGYGFGSVIWNPVETAFVNPGNEEAQYPNGTTSGDKYFTDEDLLGRVPYLFLLIGGSIALMQIISILAIRDPSDDEERELLGNMTILMEDLVEKEDKSLHSVKPKGAVKTWAFWIFYISFFSMNLLTLFISNYQKAFGLQFIDDDKFLSLASTLQNVMNGASRIFWGIIYDKFGYKFTMMFVTCISTAFAASFGNIVFLEKNSTGVKIFFAVWSCGVYATNPGAYACFPPQIMKCFGPKHNATLYGLIFTASIFCSIVLLTVAQTLFPIIGYTGMFAVTGLVGALSIVVTLTWREELDEEEEVEKKEVI
ncbi:hypothetical protein TCAL_09716 [Tigriopus californicus]|uniref:Major facilitator superfamily (MFS) profile domain-containing protein n=2 Tax=Tigriopus californicus TaxID=6832 RepID=A0A553P3X5_TIGCA|nr:hypothetical protein TCAL_09716 [Tigriopus californicus]